MNALRVSFVSCFLLASTLIAFATATESLIVNGSGRDRASALDSAKRAAIDEVLASVLVLDKNKAETTALYDLLRKRIPPLMDKLEVVNEGLRDGQYQLTLSTLPTDVMDLIVADQQSADNILNAIGRPRIMFFVEDEIGYYWYHRETGNVETLLAAAFFERNFNVVDQNQVDQIRKNDQARLAAAGDPTAMQELGRMFKADCIVVGKARATEAAGAYGMQAVRADLNVRVVRVETGELLGIAQVNATKAQTTYETAALTAFETIAQEGAQKIIGHLIARWKAEAAGAKSILVQIAGFDYAAAGEFENWLATKVAHASHVELRSFEGSVAEYEVAFDGKSSELAKLITAAHANSLSVTSVTASKIVVVAK
jgi:hypothetical protein